MSASGNEATSFNSPPSALTYLRSVLTYISSRRSSFETAACSTLMALATSTCVTFRALRSSWSCICTSMASARAAARACASGDILARNSLNFLAIDLPFLSQSLDVRVVQLVGHRHMHVVPAVITGLVAAEQKDGATARVERWALFPLKSIPSISYSDKHKRLRGVRPGRRGPRCADRLHASSKDYSQDIDKVSLRRSRQSIPHHQFAANTRLAACSPNCPTKSSNPPSWTSLYRPTATPPPPVPPGSRRAGYRGHPCSGQRRHRPSQYGLLVAAP